MDTSVESLEANKVRLHVAVPAAEFDRAIDAAFRQLAREVKIPGFRPGKAPRRLLEARLGTEVARDRALRDALPGYYAEAVAAESLDAIAPPEIELTAGADDGDVEFDAVVELRPVITLTGYDELTVTVPSPEVTDDAVRARVDALRERFADLEESAAPLSDGDYAQIDIKGYVHDEPIDNLTATDFLYEVGSGIVVPELDAELAGKRPGDILKFTATLPEGAGERAGQEVAFQVLVKETKRKVLAEPTDEWVDEVTEFATLAELEADVHRRLEVLAMMQAQMARREKVLDALAGLVDAELPEPLVREEMERRLHDLVHRLEHQGLTLPQYLAATGQDQESFVAAVRESAAQAARADLALRAVVAQEGIETTEDELDAEIGRLAERLDEKPDRVRADLDRKGVLEAVRSDIARGNALQLVVERATVMDDQGNRLDLTSEPNETAERTKRMEPAKQAELAERERSKE